MDHPAEEWADDFLDSVFPPDTPPQRRAHARSLLCDWRPATTAALLEVMAEDFRPGLPMIRTPTTIVRGTADLRSPRSASLEMCQLLPDARLVEIAGAGHELHWSGARRGAPGRRSRRAPIPRRLGDPVTAGRRPRRDVDRTRFQPTHCLPARIRRRPRNGTGTGTRLAEPDNGSHASVRCLHPVVHPSISAMRVHT
jgi:hypothetical protein